MNVKAANISGLERHNSLVRFLRIFTVPLLNSLPARFIQLLMRKSSHDAATVVAKGGSTHALEAMYTRYHRSLFARGFLQGIADAFWHHLVSQPSSLRNRVRIVQSLLEEEILFLIADRKKNNDSSALEILSIAGGSSRAVTHALKKLRDNQSNPFTIRVTTLDKDRSAIEAGKRLAESFNLSEDFQWIHGNARDVKTLVATCSFDIVEIVGLLDYFDAERAVRLLAHIRGVMKTGSVLLVANVLPNKEQPFVHKTGWPSMYYRTPAELQSILNRAGFKKENDMIIEPLRVHAIAVAKL